MSEKPQLVDECADCLYSVIWFRIIGLIHLAFQVEVRVSSEVIVDALYFSKRFPRPVADQVLDAFGQCVERIGDTLVESMVSKQKLHVSLKLLYQFDYVLGR